MKLIGMFDSPFVRRVAITMRLHGMPFEHLDWSVGRDFARIREYSPLGRVPALVLDDGEVLAESAAILDFLDEQAGAQRALLPASGAERRHALQRMALAVGAAEKGRELIYENAFRPPEKRHEPWLERCRSQIHGAFGELDRACAARGAGEWLVGSRMTQADITTACMVTFLTESVGLSPEAAPYPALRALVARCEALPQFREFHVPWFAPNP